MCRDGLTMVAMSTLLHAPQPMSDGGLEAWREFGAVTGGGTEGQRNGLVGDLEEALAPDENKPRDHALELLAMQIQTGSSQSPSAGGRIAQPGESVCISAATAAHTSSSPKARIRRAA